MNRRPEVLAKVIAECNEVLGDDPSMAREVLLQNRHKTSEMKYISAVIKETLRLHPPAGTV